MKTETMNMHLLLDLNAHHFLECFLIWKSLLAMSFNGNSYVVNKLSKKNNIFTVGVTLLYLGEV